MSLKWSRITGFILGWRKTEEAIVPPALFGQKLNLKKVGTSLILLLS